MAEAAAVADSFKPRIAAAAAAAAAAAGGGMGGRSGSGVCEHIVAAS